MLALFASLPGAPGPLGLGLAALGLLLAGVLKGATGAGAPIIAIPVLATVFDVPTAVTVMAAPNFFTNAWQAWGFRDAQRPRVLTWRLVIGAMVGTAVGTAGLVGLPQQGLMLLLAACVVAYLSFRLARPHWGLSPAVAQGLSGPVGLVSGLLQGAAGLSAPVSITFLNAVRLERAGFIAVASLFFAAMSVTQVPALAAFGLLTVPILVASLAAGVLILSAMPLGRVLARRISAATFDRLILGLLAVVAVKLVADALG
jgi:uncharacterized membrane protein YfcA